MRGGFSQTQARPEDWFAQRGSGPAALPQRVFDISDLMSALRGSRRLIAMTVATTTVLGLVAGMMIPRSYQASTQLYIDARGVKVLANDISPQAAIDAAIAEFESQIKILGSGSVMLRVAERERLGSDPAFIPAPGLTSRLRALLPGAQAPAIADRNQTAASILERRITIKRAERSFVVEVIASDSDPQRAARLSQAVAEVYLESRTLNRRDLARRLGGEVSERLQDLRERVEAAEKRLNDFKTANNLIYSSGGLVTEQDLTELNNQLNSARARTARAKARLDQISRLTGTAAAAATAEVLDSPTIVQLRVRLAEANRQSAELRKNLGPLHPDIQAADERIREANSAIAAEIERRRISIRNDHEQALAGERVLARQINELKSKSTDIGQSLIALRELERAVETNRKVYEEFLLRSRELAEQQGLSTSASYVITNAVAPAQPGGLPFPAFLALGFIGGFPIGIGLALLRHAVTRPPGATSPEEPRQFEHQATGSIAANEISAAAISRYVAAGCLSRVLVPPDALSDLAEMLGDRIGLDRRAVILIAGDGRGGSAELAAALAACWSYDGHDVLAIDGDSRSARLSMIAGGHGNPGLFDRLHRDVEAFVQWKRKGLPHLLTSLDPALRRDISGARRIVSQRLVDITDAVETVIIDAGDLAANPFGAALAKAASACIVVSADENARSALTAIERLGLAPAAHIVMRPAAAPAVVGPLDIEPAAASGAKPEASGKRGLFFRFARGRKPSSGPAAVEGA